MNYTTGYGLQRTVFRYAQKACRKDFFGDKLLFLIKIENFYQKQQLLSYRLFIIHYLSYHFCNTPIACLPCGE